MPLLYYQPISGIAKKIRSKEISPCEVVDAHLRRAAELHPQLNAFVHIDEAGARKQAQASQRSVLDGDLLGPLHGVPLTIKSCIDVTDWPCAAGSLLRKENQPSNDAVLVRRLREAGAILLGNTNTPEFLMAYETDNRLSGKTSNPWNREYSSGGSSGGEAAAIASGCSAGGAGSDGGGSIRVPAHFCGICGLKPTPGRIPSTGHYPAGNSAFGWLGVVGPMARTVGDLKILFEVLHGPDADDALSSPVQISESAGPAPGKLRIGILEGDGLGSVTPETQLAVRHAAQLLAYQGFILEPFRLNNLERVLEVWWLPAPPITMERFVAMCTARDRERARILEAMRDVPLLLSPVCAAPAFRHGKGNWKTGEGYRDTMRHSQWLNLAGFPGVSVPMGKSPEGLPIGVQLIGRPYEDELVLSVAERLESARGAWQPPPLP